MCSIDFGTPIYQFDEELNLKKLEGSDLKVKCRRCNEPVLFVGHLSKGSLFVMEKPWSQVVTTFDALPVHRHIYGT